MEIVNSVTEDSTNSIIEAITNILLAIGENPKREGLKETPRRVLNSYTELFAGYKQDPEKILSTSFVEGTCDEMIIVKDIEFYSMCEHHILPFYGKVDFGYIPNGKIVGVSKIARLIDVFSRRLQIQERMTSEIADSFEKVIQPQGVMVVVEAVHLCMVARGIKKQHSKMITSAIRGVFKEKETRDEFLELRGK